MAYQPFSVQHNGKTRFPFILALPLLPALPHWIAPNSIYRIIVRVPHSHIVCCVCRRRISGDDDRRQQHKRKKKKKKLKRNSQNRKEFFVSAWRVCASFSFFMSFLSGSGHFKIARRFDHSIKRAHSHVWMWLTMKQKSKKKKRTSLN